MCMAAQNRDYSFSAEFADERARLAGIESLWDPGSRALLTDVGVGRGWRCLEVGPGGGSLVEWMAARGAHVTAVDVDTRYIDDLESDSVAIVRGDVRQLDLSQPSFDLVHARLVLEHLVDRRQVLDRLVATLRPGGWMVIEDLDWTTLAMAGDDEAFMRVVEVALQLLKQAGYDRDYGRMLIGDMAEAGLSAVRGEGRVHIVDHRSRGLDFFRFSIASLREAALGAGLLSAQEIDAAAERLDRELWLTTPMMVAGVGQRG